MATAQAPTLPFYLVDAFATQPFSGHLAAVVLCPPVPAAGPSTKAMQRIAAELRMETAFVRTPGESDGGDPLSVRYFTPLAESDGGGHAVVASYVALLDAGQLAVGEGETRSLRQQGRRGTIDVQVHRRAAGAPVVTTRFEQLHFGAALERDEVAAALRIPDSAIVHAPRLVQPGDSGPIGVVALAQATTLHGAKPDFPALASLSRRRAFQGLAVFARPGVEASSAVTARFFYPAVRPDEDVVSGAGLAGIGAYAVRERLLPCVVETTIHTEQGHAFGRPNRASVTVRATGGAVSRVEVAGEGVVTARGALRPPQGL
jgi:PhzF family phenazine biosynthesis protein